jgi:hypothetical protein
MSSKDPSVTTAHIRKAFAEVGWEASLPRVEQVLSGVTEAFRGHWPDYLRNDMNYHDLGHTLEASVCVADLATGLARSGDEPDFDRHAGELTVIAALLHDSGFLKKAGDTAGTGAKYTLVHERRSCDFARAYLPRLGVAADDITDICAAISCTGPRNRISAQTFRNATARRIACLLVTADYVAQMAAPDYPDKLDHLFAEFTEAFDHSELPAEKRPYASAAELKRRTPDFWVKFVRPMLDTEADGVHRYFSVTGQTNPYLQAVEENLAEIRRRLP